MIIKRNEYITDAGLNWMSFGARQYDPQLGRFLSVDPLAAVGGQDMLSPYQAMGNNPVSSMDPGGTAYYSMENYVDNRGNRFYLSPGTIASLGLPWTGDPTGFTPPPSWDYGAFFDASCNAAMIEFTKFEISTSLKRIIRDREDDNKIAEKYGLNSVTLMLNLTVPLDNKWYYHDPDDKGNGGAPPTKEEADEHYMNGHGEPMSVALSKVDLSFLDPTDFDEKKWTTKVVQTLGRSKDGKVFGHITLTYLGGNKVMATTGYDDYDFEMHPWSKPGSWIRNIETIIGEPGQGTGFRIYLIGTGTISPLPKWRQRAYQMINQFESYFLPYK